MKLSTFNIEKEIPDGIIVYNTFSSGVLFLNNEYKNEYLNLKKGKKVLTSANNKWYYIVVVSKETRESYKNFQKKY